MAQGDLFLNEIPPYAPGIPGNGPGSLRTRGPYNLRFDQADLPGTSETYTLVGFGPYGGDNPSSGTFDLVGGSGSATLPYNATAADVQAALEGLFGVGNVDLIDTAPFETPPVLWVLFTGTLASQPVALSVANDTTDSAAVAASEEVAGDDTPRIGRTLFTPDVGDLILDLFFYLRTTFIANPPAEVDVWFGDWSRWSIPHAPADHGAGGGYVPGIGALAGGSFTPLDSFNAIPPMIENGLPFSRVKGTNGTGSGSADYTVPWGPWCKVLRPIPLAVQLAAQFGPKVLTAGEVDIYVLVAEQPAP